MARHTLSDQEIPLSGTLVFGYVGVLRCARSRSERDGGIVEVSVGTDIHGWVEVRPAGDGKAPWAKVGEVPDDRNYVLFSLLADARGDGTIRPIAEPRGLPEDYVPSEQCAEYCDCREMESGNRAEDHYVTDWWVEDGHSITWYDLRELAADPGWNREFRDYGWISRERYDQWNIEGRKGAPYPYSKSIDGGSVVHAHEGNRNSGVEEFVPEGWTHIRVAWTDTPATRCTHWIEWMHETIAKHPDKDIRIVIGFDS